MYHSSPCNFEDMLPHFPQPHSLTRPDHGARVNGPLLDLYLMRCCG